MRQRRPNPCDNYTVIPGSGERPAVTGASPTAGMNTPRLCLLKIGFPALPKSNLSYLLTHVHLLIHSLLSSEHTVGACLSGHAVEASRRTEKLQRNEFLFNCSCLITNQEQAIKIESFARQAHAGICLLHWWQNSCFKYSVPTSRDLQSPGGKEMTASLPPARGDKAQQAVADGCVPINCPEANKDKVQRKTA